METCERLGSCVYRQYDAGTCYLCIKNAADVTSEGGLTSTTVQQVETHVKLGVEDVIFTSQSCEGPRAPAETNPAIHFDSRAADGHRFL